MDKDILYLYTVYNEQGERVGLGLAHSLENIKGKAEEASKFFGSDTHLGSSPAKSKLWRCEEIDGKT